MVPVPGEDWDCVLMLGSHWSVLERAVVGGRWSEPSMEQSWAAATVLIILTSLSGTARNLDAAA